MTAFLNFAKAMITAFFNGFWLIIKGFYDGIVKIFNVGNYISIFQQFDADFNFGNWVLSFVLVLLMVAVLAGIIYLIVFLIRRRIRFRKSYVSQDELLAEVAALNREVMKAKLEKEKVLAMKLAQIGPEIGRAS